MNGKGSGATWRSQCDSSYARAITRETLRHREDLRSCGLSPRTCCSPISAHVSVMCRRNGSLRSLRHTLALSVSWCSRTAVWSRGSRHLRAMTVALSRTQPLGGRGAERLVECGGSGGRGRFGSRGIARNWDSICGPASYLAHACSNECQRTMDASPDCQSCTNATPP